jgi:heparan-alpha-glucosaminide N-acetyltransferase
MSTQPPSAPSRLASLDAYRGFIMLVMASGGFGFAEVAKKHFPDNPWWNLLGYEFDHVAWTGCAFWDLIQPSFMFMVGVAMPFSHASRVLKGQSPAKIGAHVIYRSLVLILLGIFLSSNGASQTNFTFVNVLTQIGLGYAFVYLLLGRSFTFQLLVLLAILGGYWYLFFQQPVQDPGYAILTSAARDRDLWFSGLFAHWNKNANFAAEFDQWFLNLFPRSKPFYYNEGGYQTLNFVPSMATMILGLMAGELLRSLRRPMGKFLLLVGAGAICLAIGLVLDATVCPSVKRIWTPSWAIFSAGWVFWILACFYLIIDVIGFRLWAFPLIVVGMNSIAMYCMSQLLGGRNAWIRKTLSTHLDWGYQALTGKTPPDSIWQSDFGPHLFGGTYGPIVQSVAVLSVLWLICLWMYRRGIFLRI